MQMKPDTNGDDNIMNITIDEQCYEKQEKQDNPVEKSKSADLETSFSDDDQNLQDLYNHLDLKELKIIAVNKDSASLYKKSLEDEDEPVLPYGGYILDLKGLNKAMNFGEICSKISELIGWPIEEMCLQEQFQYENYIKDVQDLDFTEIDVDLIPKPIQYEDEFLLFPKFVSNQIIVVEHVDELKLPLPESSHPQYLTRTKQQEIMKMYQKGQDPPIEKLVYDKVDIIEMPRYKPSNTLFSALGYQLHDIESIEEQKNDDDIGGMVQASVYRGGEIRKSLAKFVIKNFKLLENSALFDDLSIFDYPKKVLDYNYSGSNIDIQLAALMFGCWIQVYDVYTRRLRLYGQGSVERYGNPKRLGPRFLIKLVRWKDKEYDAMTFCLNYGMYQIRREDAFSVSYSILAFDWMCRQNKKFVATLRRCAECDAIEEHPSQFNRCSQCKIAYFCSKKCQIRNQRESHKIICIKKNFDEEPIARSNETREVNLIYSEILEEINDQQTIKEFEKVTF